VPRDLIASRTSVVSVMKEAVNTVTVKGKRKAFRGKPFKRSDYKKAIVTLEEGQQIDVTTGL